MSFLLEIQQEKGFCLVWFTLIIMTHRFRKQTEAQACMGGPSGTLPTAQLVPGLQARRGDRQVPPSHRPCRLPSRFPGWKKGIPGDWTGTWVRSPLPQGVGLVPSGTFCRWMLLNAASAGSQVPCAGPATSWSQDPGEGWRLFVPPFPSWLGTRAQEELIPSSACKWTPQ